MKYDFLIVGAGLFGAVCARELTDAGYLCHIIEKRSVIGGNIRTERQGAIDVHLYGAHIFHTSRESVWNYVNRFARFNHYIHMPVANSGGRIYSLPFNLHTFQQMWGISTPEAARKKIAAQRLGVNTPPRNLEEQAISLVGREIYEKLIKGYTEKQWGKPCRDLPASIIRRLPVRYTFDNRYFSDRYQGIPEDGYGSLIAKMLDGIAVETEADFNADRAYFSAKAKKIIYTGPIDAYFSYSLGALAWRGLRFETETLDAENFQGVAVMNFNDDDPPYTRIIEHKHFKFLAEGPTVITREYPAVWNIGDEPFYPINDEINMTLYARYEQLAKKEHNVFFGGRLGLYRYLDMDKTIEAAWKLIKQISSGRQ